MTSFKPAFLLLTFITVQFVADRAAAVPVVLGSGHHTDRYAPHSVPGWPQGDVVQISLGLNSTDPPGSQSIVVNAHQGATTLALDWYSLPTTIYPTPHLYYKFFELNPALTGPWEIIPTDSTGTGPSSFTNAILAPEFLPVPEGITVQGTPVGASVKWTLPDLTGFDVEYVQVRIIQVSPLAEVFMSNFLPVHTTSFAAPPGLLHVGVEYVYQVSLEDVEGAYEENRSNALSAPFRFTIPGDFNTDGTVDAADYTVWRKTGGSQDNYNTWRSHFGQTAGSAASLPSDASLSAAVPETSALSLLTTFGLLAICRRRGLAKKN